MAARGYKGNLDEYIKLHFNSMSQAEMARATGASTSQVSRRVIALREAGQLKPPQRDGDAEPAPNERLQALEELVNLLHSELATAGGQSLARVSSEYRAALLERDNLRAELGITQDKRYKVSMLTYLIMLQPISELVPLHPIPENAQQLQERDEMVVKATLHYLQEEDAIVVKPGVLKGLGKTGGDADEDADELEELQAVYGDAASV